MTSRKSRTDGDGVRPYHHGSLRAAVTKAALDALADRTPESLSLRELARVVGVGHSALYGHFRDRDELLAIIAGEGFQALESALLSASQTGSENGVGALALAYIAFARTSPAHYRTMFRPENVTDANMGHVLEASDRCFSLLVGAVQQQGGSSESEARERSAGIWSLLHGLVVLGENSGPLQQKVAPENEAALGAKLAGILAGG